MSIGDRIRTCRIEQGIRRKELAAMIGKSYEHVANIENGHTNGAPETLVDIAKALGVPVKRAMAGDWTVAHEDPQPQPAEPKREPQPTSHPQPSTPVPPPPPRRRNGAKGADGARVVA